MQNKKVIIYARAASQEQNVDVHDSHEQQLKICREYCEQNNLDALMEIRELGSGSASLSPGLAEYLQLVKVTQYDISGIVVTDAIRISRNLQTYTEFMQKLQKLGITLYVVNETLVSQLIHSIAATERQIMSKKIKAGIARKKQTQGKMLKFTAKGRNIKHSGYTKEVITNKNKARRTTK